MVDVKSTELPIEGEGLSLSDLCQQCTILAPKITLSKNSYNQHSHLEYLRVVEGSTCPLCLFFASILHVQEWPTIVQTNTPFRLYHYWRELAQGLQENYYLVAPHQDADNHSRRFVVPVLDSDNLVGGDTVRYRPLSKHSIDYPLLRKCIAYCQEHHGNTCSRQGELSDNGNVVALKFKLFDCIKMAIVAAPPDARYVALSYVWGKPSTATMPNSSDSGRQDLPNTIKDAIRVTLELGFRYLWVDQCCIDQADPHDLRAQVSIMDRIYTAASVTIIAAAGRDSSYGLPGVGERGRCTPPTINLNGTTWMTMVDIMEPVRKSPWSERAWTYQEEFYSRRRLIFTDEQVIFKCSEMGCSESAIIKNLGLIDGLPFATIFGTSTNVDKRQKRTPYLTHLEAYTKRKLTNQSDVLNAMRGLFRSLASKKRPWQQYWGIPVTPSAYEEKQKRWEDRGIYTQDQLYIVFFHGLCWSTDSSFHAGACPARREGFPSWSWAGWIAAVRWPTVLLLDSKADFPIRISVQRTNGTHEPLTNTLAASIFQNPENVAPQYTYHLRIWAEVIDLKFTYITVACKPPKPIFDPDARTNYVARAAVPDLRQIGRSCDQTYSWPLALTPQVQIHDELHHALCQEVFCAVVLNDLYALVTRTKDGVAERIGLINVRGVRDTDDELDFSPHLHLRNYFPGRWREILLG